MECLVTQLSHLGLQVGGEVVHGLAELIELADRATRNAAAVVAALELAGGGEHCLERPRDITRQRRTDEQEHQHDASGTDHQDGVALVGGIEHRLGVDQRQEQPAVGQWLRDRRVMEAVERQVDTAVRAGGRGAQRMNHIGIGNGGADHAPVAENGQTDAARAADLSQLIPVERRANQQQSGHRAIRKHRRRCNLRQALGSYRGRRLGAAGACRVNQWGDVEACLAGTHVQDFGTVGRVHGHPLQPELGLHGREQLGELHWIGPGDEYRQRVLVGQQLSRDFFIATLFQTSSRDRLDRGPPAAIDQCRDLTSCGQLVDRRPPARRQEDQQHHRPYEPRPQWKARRPASDHCGSRCTSAAAGAGRPVASSSSCSRCEPNRFSYSA